MTDDIIGQRLGQYEVIGLLGEGGMAAVYRARQDSIKRDVAVKIIKTHLIEMEDFVQRFEREAQTVASLSHAHILKVFDYGQHGSIVYLVMELLTGGSLADLIKKGPMQPKQVSRLLDQIASALDYAHQKGVIHRDLKPENVLLDETGDAFLTDFGLAKLLNTGLTLTQSGIAMGTPAYMSPEQWQSKPLDARADIYALGIMVFEMLSGALPFQGDTPLSMMYLHINEPAPLIQTVRPDIPSAIEDVLQKALAKLPEQRYQSAGQFTAAFKAALVGKRLPGTAPLRQPVMQMAAPAPTIVLPATAQERQNRQGLIALVTLMVIALVILAFVGLRMLQPMPTIPTVAPGIAELVSPTVNIVNWDTPIAMTFAAQSTMTANASYTNTPTARATTTPTSTASPSRTYTATRTPATPTASTPVTSTIYPLLSGSARAANTARPFVGHTAAINSVTFSRDGKYIVTGSTDKTARLWDVQSGKAIQTFSGHQDSINSVAFSPYGKYIVTGAGDGTSMLWETQSGKAINTYAEHGNRVNCALFSPDGLTILSGGNDAVARLRDAMTGRTVRVYSGRHTDRITSLAFSLDGRYFVSGSFDRTAVLWHIESGKVVRVFTGHTDRVHSVAFSPDGRYILTGSADRTARLWDIPTGQLVRVLVGHSADIRDVAFSPDGYYILTGSSDSTARLWEAQTGKMIRSFTGHRNAVMSLAFSPDSQSALTGSADGMAILWSLRDIP